MNIVMAGNEETYQAGEENLFFIPCFDRDLLKQFLVAIWESDEDVNLIIINIRNRKQALPWYR